MLLQSRFCQQKKSRRRERVVCIFFPPLFQIRLSTSKQQEIHCDPQSFTVHALIQADKRCSNNFPRYLSSVSSEPIKQRVSDLRGRPSARLLISSGQTQALTCPPPPQVLVIKAQPLRPQCWNRTWMPDRSRSPF